MTDAQELTPAEWFATLRDDYLDTYVPRGGASVKVAVARALDLARIRATFETFARANDFAYAAIDSAAHELHALESLYHELARQLPWEGLARAFTARALDRAGIRVPLDGRLDATALAETNATAFEATRARAGDVLTNAVAFDYALSREFRAAALALCRGILEPSRDALVRTAAVLDWLHGENPKMPVLRRIGITRGISRANARQLLYSTSAWIKAAGRAGLILTLDMSNYTLGKDVPAHSKTYTKATAMDMNEVVRLFVDSVDDLTASLVVFLTTERFLDDATLGLRSYDALRLRLTDDVRDRKRPNPFGPLVRLRYPR